jgi:2-oxoglutarate dehydrogenase E2 component (dihydrolipoamide succinyltransferase)
MSLVDIAVPDDLEGTKSVIRTWLKKPGEAVAANEALVELETDKVSMEVFAPQAGILQDVLMQVGEDAGPGALLGRISVGGAAVAPQAHSAAAEAPAQAAKPEATAPAPVVSGSIADFDPALRLSPAVRRLLMESGADPAGMTGTGKDGRLTRDDVQKHLDAGPVPQGSVAKPPAPAAHTPVAAAKPGSRTPSGTRIPHDGMRLRIAQNMASSLANAPHVTAVFEADFGAIQVHRAAHKAEFAKQGVNLTYTAYIVAACVEAMKVAPTVNSRWHDDALEVFDDYNIGVGTALGDKGLIVPVVHQAQSLSLLGIAQRLQDTVERARKGKLTPGDVSGGTFTISNHGVSGSLFAAPIIINQPQSAILGVGKLEKRVVVKEVGGADVIAIRPLAYVSLSIDHRVLDGHQTNTWLSRFVEVLETWPAA